MENTAWHSLYALHGLMRFYPNRFSLIAITVDLGYPDFHLDAVKQLCQELEVPYYVVKTEIARLSHLKKMRWKIHALFVQNCARVL